MYTPVPAICWCVRMCFSARRQFIALPRHDAKGPTRRSCISTPCRSSLRSRRHHCMLSTRTLTSLSLCGVRRARPVQCKFCCFLLSLVRVSMRRRKLHCSTLTSRLMQSCECLCVPNRFHKDQVCMLSNDDKARIGMGINSVARQGKMFSRVELPPGINDHSFPFARSKLICSVYSACLHTGNEFFRDGDPRCISWSGPTGVILRNGASKKLYQLFLRAAILCCV